MTYRKSMSDAIREVQESTIKPYVSMSMGGQYNVLDKDGKVAYSTRDKTLAYDYFKKNFDKLKEELQETPQGFALVSKAKELAKKFANNMSKAVAEIEKLEKGLSNNSSVKDALQKANESLEIDEEVSEQFKIRFTDPANKKKFHIIYRSKGEAEAKMAQLKRDGVKQIEIVSEDLDEEVSLQEVSDNLKLAVLKRKIKQYKDKVFKKTMSTIKSPLFAGYEEMEEGRMKDIFTADQEGKSAEEIAKLMKLPLNTVKNILGEEVFEEQILEFTSDMIKRLQKSYATMPQKITPEQAKALSKHLDRLDLASLKQLTKSKIPFVTTLARNKVYKKTGKFEEVIKEEEQDVDKIALAKEKDTDALEKQLTAAQGQINVLKQKIENEKNKSVKPMPNPETGEVPLTVGIAHKILNDKAKAEKEERDQKEISKQIKTISKGGTAPTTDGTKLESFTRKYLSYLNESDASDKAKALGLTYMSFGRYGKDGKVTHKSSGGNLTALSKKDQEKDTDVKPAKPKTKTTGNIKNPDGANTTSGQIKKEILKKIDDKDIESDYSILPKFEDELTALADDLAGTGDKETAEKITDALFAAQEDDKDTAAKVDDMMNALKGRPDVNGAKQKELSSMTTLYTDATYSSKNFKDFVSDTSNMVSKMGELADAGSMDSDAYGPGIRSDAMAELASTASEIQDKIEDMDMNDDIKTDINAALSTITDTDTDEYTEEGHIYMAIKNLKYQFKRLGKVKKKSKVKNESLEVNETMSDKEKRLQRAKDMIKYYDAQKKAALKGPNKALAKKMLKNDSEDQARPKKKETPPLDTTGVVEEVKESVNDIKKNPNWKLQPGGGMYPKYKHPKHGNINIDRYGEWQHVVNGKVVAFFSPSYPDNKLSNTGATSMDLSDYMKLKKINEDLKKEVKEEKRLYIESIIKKLRIKK